jgi:ATP synthase protein I
MPERPVDDQDRPPMTVAMEWSARITTIALEMALPAGGGHWLDTRFGTSPILTAIGALLGLTVGMLHLLQIARQQSKKKP